MIQSLIQTGKATTVLWIVVSTQIVSFPEGNTLALLVINPLLLVFSAIGLFLATRSSDVKGIILSLAGLLMAGAWIVIMVLVYAVVQSM